MMSRATKRLLAHALLVPITGFAILGMDAVFTIHDPAYFKSPFTIAMVMLVGLLSQVGAALVIRQASVKGKEVVVPVGVQRSGLVARSHPFGWTAALDLGVGQSAEP
jgi:hypothetical protein